MTTGLLAEPVLGKAGPAASGSSTRRIRRHALLLRLATIVLAIAAWAALASGPLARSDYIASPWEVARAFGTFVLTAAPLHALWVTTERFLAAFAVAAVLGVCTGVLLGRSGRHTFAAARDVAVVLYTLPLVPFYPLFVLWLGLGAKSEIAFGAVHGLVPIILVTMSAASRVNADLLSAAEALGASRLQRFGKVVLPSIVPEMVGALRVGAALSLLGVLLGELMISFGGAGELIGQLIANLRPAELDAVLVAVCAGALVVNSVMTAMERRLSRWR